MLFAAAIGCGKRAPTGALGARWGEPVTEIARRFGIDCALSPHSGDYRSCRGDLRVFDRDARVMLVSRNGQLVGVSVDFVGDCHYRDIQREISETFGVEYTPGAAASPYTSWSSGEVVHFRECVLTVGNGDYGDHFVAERINRAFRDLGDSMTPH